MSALLRLRATARRPEAALFTLAFGAYAYFFQAGGWNQNSRFDTVRAIVEQHSLIIDDYAGNTGDFAVVNHHFYGDKAPGLSMLAVPVYAAVYPLAHGQRVHGRVVSLGAYLATLVGVALPAALAVVALRRTAVRLGTTEAAAAGLAVAYAFGTLAFPYATLFYSHQLTASLLLLAFALLVGEKGEPPRAARTARRLLLAGLLLGYAVATEYPAALAVAVLAGYALAVTRPRARVVWLALGGVVPALALAVYHTAVFGGPLTVGYNSSPDSAREGGLVLGITLPSARVLWKVLFSTDRGLLHHAPWLVFALPGLVRMVRSRALRAEGLACAGVIAAGLWFNSSLTSTPGDWKGGAGIGTRHLVPSLPFWVLAVAGLAVRPARGWRARPRVRWAGAAVLGVLVALSASRMLMATAVRPEPYLVDDPFEDYILPRWRSGQVAVNTIPIHTGFTEGEPQAWNLGQKMGLRGRASLLPLGLFAAAAGAWLAMATRDKRPAASPSPAAGAPAS